LNPTHDHMNLFSSLDSFVFLVYFVLVAGYGL
jgi:hypothetical protein